MECWLTLKLTPYQGKIVINSLMSYLGLTENVNEIIMLGIINTN